MKRFVVLDLGTTTLTGHLISASGEVLAEKNGANPQREESTDILGRLRALFVQSEEPDTITWQKMVQAMGMFSSPDPLKLLQVAITDERRPGSSLLDWAAHHVVLKAALAAAGCDLGDAIWVRLLVSQTSKPEQLLLGTVASWRITNLRSSKL